ncbi:MAG TPA: FAD/NAD(P)-binding protein [Magnetospirillaceae bacterium]|nr:FAD/NAD(P)-binding protein [Magnetospirillaceae bacterium]
MTARKTPSFGIVGAGFSGSLLAVHLLRRLPQGSRVHLIERRGEFGSGLAFSTPNSSHLLNVRAERMSAFEKEPAHFLDWLSSLSGEDGLTGAAFVPRGLYGRYIQSLLADQLGAENGNRNLYLFPDEAVDLELSGDGAVIQMSGGRPVKVDAVVLAVGNFPPQVPSGAEALAGSPAYVPNPWDYEVTRAISHDASLLVIGTGLTMVDFVLNMLDRGHRGPIHAMSRRGLLPHRHAPSPPPVPWVREDDLPLSKQILKMRSAVETQDWRAVFDGVRPYTQAWWSGLPIEERKRFLRHLRPWWDIHRHRMAPEVARRIDEAIGRGALSVLAGRFQEIEAVGHGLAIRYRPRGKETEDHLAVDHVVNCSGPSSDYGAIEQKLVRALFDRGEIRPDPLSLGLDVDASLKLIGQDGKVQDRLYGLGPVTKGRFWECTAVPEIRRQAEELAERLVADWL